MLTTNPLMHIQSIANALTLKPYPKDKWLQVIEDNGGNESTEPLIIRFDCDSFVIVVHGDYSFGYQTESGDVLVAFKQYLEYVSKIRVATAAIDFVKAAFINSMAVTSELTIDLDNLLVGMHVTLANGTTWLVVEGKKYNLHPENQKIKYHLRLRNTINNRTISIVRRYYKDGKHTGNVAALDIFKVHK